LANLFLQNPAAETADLEPGPRGHPVTRAVLAESHATVTDADMAAAARRLLFDFTIDSCLSSDVFYPTDKAERIRRTFTAAGIRVD